MVAILAAAEWLCDLKHTMICMYMTQSHPQSLPSPHLPNSPHAHPQPLGLAGLFGVVHLGLPEANLLSSPSVIRHRRSRQHLCSYTHTNTLASQTTSLSLQNVPKAVLLNELSPVFAHHAIHIAITLLVSVYLFCLLFNLRKVLLNFLSSETFPDSTQLTGGGG